jgi:hypothetical protein
MMDEQHLDARKPTKAEILTAAKYIVEDTPLESSLVVSRWLEHAIEFWRGEQ